MNDTRRRPSPPADILLVFRRLRSEDQAVRLARAAGWLLMLAGVVVVLLGFLMNHPQTMIEGTLVTLLALVAGWVRSRLAAVFLGALLALGLAGGFAAGVESGTTAFLLITLVVALRLLEATFRFRRSGDGSPST